MELSVKFRKSSLIKELVPHQSILKNLLVNYTDIQTAAQRAAGIVRRTPLIENDALNERVGKRVLVKLECLQHTGSFKWRGAWNAVKTFTETTVDGGVIAYSSGNHGQGIARAAKLLGRPVVIVMPVDAPVVKIRNTRAYGADVVFYDRPNGESRETVCAAIAQKRNLTLIKPYDNVDVIAGQGTCGIEIAEQAASAGIACADVFVCCGGGGLTSGIALALEASVGEFTTYPVEPAAADDVCRSLVSGQRESNVGVPDTDCDAIITPSPGEITFPIMQRLCARGLSVTDHEMREAVRFAFDQLRVVAEPGGAVALAAVLAQGHSMDADALIAVITGANVDVDWLTRTLAT